MYSSKQALWLAKNRAIAGQKRFVIVGNPRTGSSHLVSMLDSHSQVACWEGELFNLGETFDQSKLPSPREFLVDCVFQVDAPVVGFKFLSEAMQRFPEFWNLFSEFNICLIHTVRRNIVDSFISYHLAARNDAFTCHYGSYKVDRILVNPSDLIEWARWTSEIDEAIRLQTDKLKLPRLEIEYEDLCRDAGPILDFLQVPQETLVSQLKKQRIGSQSDAISNYTQLKSFFTNSPIAIHFE